jgi:pimeloyl-ACP methyl ester carboxylesterase
MWLATLVLVLAGVYAAIVAVMFVAQTGMLFPVKLATSGGVPLPLGTTRLEVPTPDGERLHGVLLPAARKQADGDLLILGFGGNAWNADSLAAYLHGLYPETAVAAFHYRGYRPSTGTPSAAALLADTPLVHDHVAARTGATRIVVIGFSLGAGVAAHLAAARPLAGLVLVSPFDSIEATARHHYPWLPVRWLLRHRMSTVDAVRRAAMVPTALIAAERDTTVPPRRTANVRRAIARPVLDEVIADADHNDLYDRPDFRATMQEALVRIEAARAGGTTGRP